MPAPTTLELTGEQRRELAQVRDRHPKGYTRERAAALLKIADGQSATQVAYTGLLKKRYPHAICKWVRRYKAEGVEGLLVRQGRGRKPAFSPSATRRTGRQRADAASDKERALSAGA